MEEKKNLKLNVGGKKEEKKEQKLTYDQLNQACNQLFQQNQYLNKQLKELNTYNMFKRLDYLFKVVEFAPTFKDAEFVNYCTDEIKDALVIPENTEEDNKEK